MTAFAPTVAAPQQDPLAPPKEWLDRKDAAKRHRKPFEATWMESAHFAAGKQLHEYAQRRHRMILPERAKRAQKADMLTRYVWTVIGELTALDLQPRFLFEHDTAEGHDVADAVNRMVEYGWDHEWAGQEVVHDLILKLVIFGTAAIRCRFDRTQGPLVGRDIPHRNGVPLLDPAEAHAHMEQAYMTGQNVDLRPVREGRVVWEALSPWNMLPPPGVESTRDWPWEIIVRPVPLDTLRAQYGNAAAGLQPDGIESMDTLGLNEAALDDPDLGGNTRGKLDDHALVYTGYLYPNAEHPDGQTCVFTDRRQLELHEAFPYPENGGRPASTGNTYFRYWTVPQRFWGRGFIEPGIGPQRVRNKRLTQVDEITDRGMPFWPVERGTMRKQPEGLVMQLIETEPGKNFQPPFPGIGPGSWMFEMLNLDNENIEHALGVNLVSLGENPAGVQTYSALVQLRESDFKKIGPIADRLQTGMCKVHMDTLEAARQWPPNKKLMIAGDDGRMQQVEFNAQQIPTSYLVVPSKANASPKSAGSELQKIQDVWAARLAMGPPTQEWLEWYVASITAEQMEELPDDGGDAQRHKAALEDLAMIHTGQPVPVAEYDDANVHVPEHTETLVEQSALAEQGDPRAQAAVQAIQQHRLMHVQQAQANAQQNITAAPAPPAVGPGASPVGQLAQPPAAPPGP